MGDFLILKWPRKKALKESTTKGEEKKQQTEQKIKEDAQLREFLDLHDTNSTWSNDIAAPLNEIDEEQQVNKRKEHQFGHEKNDLFLEKIFNSTSPDM